MTLVTVAAIVIGSLAAFRPGGVFDRIVTFTSLIGASAPDFWIAIVGITVFAIGLGWLPTSGTGTVWHWILPIAVLFIRPFGLILQVVRGSMVQAFGSAYVKTARAKGVSDRSIIFVHTLRNAMLPVITVIGDQAAALLNGAVVVETIFGFPGVGKLMIDSILTRDFNVILAAIMVTAIAIFVDEPADRPRLRAARSPHPDLSHGRHVEQADDPPRRQCRPDHRRQSQEPSAPRAARPRHALARQVRHRRGDLPADRDPLRDLRPRAPRRGRDQAEPARPQPRRPSPSTTAG